MQSQEDVMQRNSQSSPHSQNATDLDKMIAPAAGSSLLGSMSCALGFGNRARGRRSSLPTTLRMLTAILLVAFTAAAFGQYVIAHLKASFSEQLPV